MPGFESGRGELGDNDASELLQAGGFELVEQVVKIVDMAHADKDIGAADGLADLGKGVVEIGDAFVDVVDGQRVFKAQHDGIGVGFFGTADDFGELALRGGHV